MLFVFLIKGGTGNSVDEKESTEWIPSGDADRTLTRNAPERVQPLVLCTTAQQDASVPQPRRWTRRTVPQLPSARRATGPESPGDEFGILEDDRCIDTGGFQPRYLVHGLVFACSLPPPPRSRVSHTFLTQADWCSTRAVARCEYVRPLPGHPDRGDRFSSVLALTRNQDTVLRNKLCAHDKSQLSQHFSQPTAQKIR